MLIMSFSFLSTSCGADLIYSLFAISLSTRFMELNNDEIRRYSRHLILPEVGLAGQKKIKATSVLCIGAGGLGSPIAMYLAAAGIGKLGIVDFDTVDYLQSPAPDSAHGRRRGPPQGAVRQGNHSRHQSELRSRHPQHPHHVAKTRSTSSGPTTSWWTARTISRRAI